MASAIEPAPPTPAAAEANPIPPAYAAPTPPIQYSDAPLESSALLMVWGRRHGELHAVDPDTGHDLRDYAPIHMGHHYHHAVSPDGNTLAAVTYPGDSGRGGVLHLIDLQAWRDVTTTLRFDSWITAMSFSPDGTRLAMAYAGRPTGAHGMPDVYLLVSVDVAGQAAVAETSFDFAPRLMKYTSDGASLIVYGVTFDMNTGLNVQPPRAVLLDAAELHVEWEVALSGVLDGQFKQKDSDGTETYVGWWPAVVPAHDGQALYIVHADEDKLTIVDFANRAARTVEVGPVRSWLEQLLALGAGVAYAKGPLDGASKRAVLSSDGARLYVIGQTTDTFRDSNGEWQFTQKQLGLKVVDVSTGVEIARFDTEATEIGMSPDGPQLYLRGWSEPDQPGLMTPWTDVLDIGHLEVVAHLTGRYIMPARRLDGRPILLSSTPHHSSEQTTLAALGAKSFDEIHVWSVPRYASWLIAP